MVNGHETPPHPFEKRSPWFLSVEPGIPGWNPFSLGSQILFLALAPLSPPVPLLVVCGAAANASGSSPPPPACM